MNAGIDKVLARIDDLEIRVAFQERALLDLGDALAASRMERARDARRLQRALEDLRQLRGMHDHEHDSGSEPPPPHY